MAGGGEGVVCRYWQQANGRTELRHAEKPVIALRGEKKENTMMASERPASCDRHVFHTHGPAGAQRTGVLAVLGRGLQRVPQPQHWQPVRLAPLWRVDVSGRRGISGFPGPVLLSWTTQRSQGGLTLPIRSCFF